MILLGCGDSYHVKLTEECLSHWHTVAIIWQNHSKLDDRNPVCIQDTHKVLDASTSPFVRTSSSFTATSGSIGRTWMGKFDQGLIDIFLKLRSIQLDGDSNWYVFRWIWMGPNWVWDYCEWPCLLTMPVRSMNQKSHQPNSPSGSDFGKSFFRDIRMWLYLKPAEQMNVKLLVPTFPNKTSAWCIISWICQLHTMTTGHTWKILTHQATRMISFLFNLMPQTPFLYRPLPVETRSGSRLAAGRFMADAAEAAEAGHLRAFGADAPFDFTFSGSGIEAFFSLPFPPPLL